MVKKFLLLMLVLIIGLVSGCAKESNSLPEDQNNDQSDELIDNVSERKIIYKVKANIDTDNLDTMLKTIKANISDGWIDEESIKTNSAYIVIRIKSNQIDEFLGAISEEGTINNLHRTATDVSITYQNKSLLIASLNAELERLIELKANASVSELIEINSRISEIDYELTKLNQELNELDSLIDYSTITFNIYGEKQNQPFGKRVVNAFLTGLHAFFQFIQILIIIIAVLIPFSVIIVPGVFFGKKISKKHKQRKMEELKKLISSK